MEADYDSKTRITGLEDIGVGSVWEKGLLGLSRRRLLNARKE